MKTLVRRDMKRSEPNIFRLEAGVKAAPRMESQADLSLVSRVRREKNQFQILRQ